MATTKQNPNLTQIDDDFLAAIQGAGSTHETKILEPAETVTPKKITKNDIKPLPQRPNVSICVNPEKKENWKTVFNAMDLTLAQGIRRAVDYYIEQIQNGNIKM